MPYDGFPLPSPSESLFRHPFSLHTKRKMNAADVRAAYKDGQRDFRDIDVDGGDFEGAWLEGAFFSDSSFRHAQFSNSRLARTYCPNVDFTGATLDKADIFETNLTGSTFAGATLRGASFEGSMLMGVDFSGADLRNTNMLLATVSLAIFSGAQLSGAWLGMTSLTDVDARPFCENRRLKHFMPSYVDARTVMRSYTHPGLREFLIQCAVPRLFSDYMIDCAWAMGESLLRSLMQSTFISYGGPDEQVARKLYEALRGHGVVVFFFPENARVGERINLEVYRRLQEHDRVILICSRASLDRPGVLNEIQETLDREARDGGATYLLPIMLDDYVLTDWRASQPVLAERIGRRIIADFRKAKRSKAEFATAVARVIDALKIRRPDARDM